MRTRHLLTTLLTAALLLAVAAPVAVPAGAAPRPTRVEAEELPGVLLPRGINDRGRILAFDIGGEIEPPDVVVVDERHGDFEVTRVGPWEQYRHPLCPTDQCFYTLPSLPYLNARGVVGTALGGHATLWDDGRTTDLNGAAVGSWLLDLSDRGEALVVRFLADHQVLGVWRRGTFTPIRTLPLDVIVNGRLSERGDVMILGLAVRPPFPAPMNFTWQDGVVTDLVNFSPGDIDRHGRIVGTTDDRSLPFTQQRGAVWDDGELTVLPTLGGRSGASFVNERGQIAGYSTRPDGTATTVLWEDGGIVDVGAQAGIRSVGPRALNERGQLLLRGATGTPDTGSLSAVWDRHGTVVLPPSGAPNLGVEAFEMNERGQVAGNVSPYDGPTVPTLWTVGR